MSIKSRLMGILNTITSPQSPDPDTALMEFMTKMILLVLSLVTVPSAIFSAFGWLSGFIPLDTLITLCLMNIVFITGWWIAHRGYWRISSLIPPVIVFAVAAYGTYLGGIEAPAMLLYVLAIIMVAVLRGERDTKIFIFMSIAVFVTLVLFHRYGYITQQRLAGTNFWNRLIIACSSIISISLLELFLIIQFRKALIKARMEINERRSIEEALRNSEKNYRELVQNANSIILRMNMKGEITFINRFAEQFFGYNISEIKGRNIIGTIMPITDSLGRDMSEILHDILKNPDDFRLNENENITRDGRRVWISWANKLITDDSRNTSEVLCIGNDITERIIALEEKEKIQNQLIHAQKMEAIGTLTSGLAHDFNNILGGIMGSLNLLEMHLAKENLREKGQPEKYIRMAVDSSKRASDMIKQLLLLSRKQEVSLKPEDINECMEHVITICMNSFPKSVAINVSYGDRPMMVLTDAILIEQVFLNFCVNASHAMTIMREPGRKEGGELTVKISSVKKDQPESFTGHDDKPLPRFIKIEISDTGIGMNEETRKRVFEPFFTLKKKGSGTGLGLSMAYGFITRLGGFIETESTPGHGSTFSIHLPEVTGQLHAAHRDLETGALLPGTGTILVIDDESALLTIAEDTLLSCGYSVLKARDGIEGLDMFRHNNERIDMVLLDISMPHMSGLEVFRLIRGINPAARVLLNSGHPDDSRIAEAMSAGANGFIQKPYAAEELSRRIHEILSDENATPVLQCPSS